MCIHRPSFLHSGLQNSCLNRQQRGIEATTVNRTASWSWSQTAQATTQVLLRLQVNDHACQAVRQVTLKSSLTQLLLARFTSRRHPNRKTKIAKPAEDHACQTLQTTWKSWQQVQRLVPRFKTLRRLNRKTKIAKPADNHACQTLSQGTQKSFQAQPLVP